MCYVARGTFPPPQKKKTDANFVTLKHNQLCEEYIYKIFDKATVKKKKKKKKKLVT